MALNNLRGAEAANLFMGDLEAQSIAFQVADKFTTSQTSVHFPRVLSTSQATFVAENAEITAGDTTGDNLEVTPAKVARLEVISRELAEDSSPAADAVLGRVVGGALAAEIDAVFFGGKGTSTVAPDGLPDLTGVTVIDADPTLSVDPFIDAIAAVEQAGTTVRAFVLNPADRAKLAKLKQGTGSNMLALGSATDGVNPTILGVPVVVSRHVAAGEAWAIPANRIYCVLREDANVVVDYSRYFEFDSVGIRATTRVAFAVLDPSAVVKIKKTV